MLAAKVITASGEVVEASEQQNKDLLWAIRGAGQFFGLVIELVVRTYDLSLIGPEGVRQLGVVYFPTSRAAEVCKTLKHIINGNDHTSAGHFMVMKDPSKGHVLMVAPQYFGTGPELQAAFKALIDLKPLEHMYQESTFECHSDHLNWMCSKGEFKGFSQTGLQSMNAEHFARLVDLHRELIESCPDTERSVFTLEWHTPAPRRGARETDTSFGLKDVDIWL